MLNKKLYGLLFLQLFFLIQCKSSNGNQNISEVKSEDNLECDIAIVGGGPAGLHTAMRLGPKYGSKICLFEKENRLGGRIYDVNKNLGTDKGPYIAVGARRVDSTQTLMIALAKELNIELQLPEKDTELIFAKGLYSLNKDDYVQFYPNLPANFTAGDVETQLIMKLFNSPERENIDAYPDFRSYVEKVLGIESLNYLRDMFRFRADYEYSLSAKGYLEFLEEEFDVCCEALYPVGGMSAFIRGMEKKVRDSGVRLFINEPVNTIDKSESGYQLVTEKRLVATKQLIIAVPPYGLEKIEGDIVKAIITQPQFKAMIGVKVTTIAQWFDKPWWKKIKTADGTEVWRAWTTGHCINSIEIPQEDYAASQNVIRTVYNDQKECAEMWEGLADDPAEMDKKLHEGLTHLFAKNGITTPVTVDQAIKTHYWEWPDAWYWIRAGNTFSNKDISQWALEPLQGEDIGLVSDGYNPQRAAWTDAAIKSSINYLDKRFKLKLGQEKGFNLNTSKKTKKDRTSSGR